MSVAIQAEQLGKLYHVDHAGSSAVRRNLGETITDWIRSPIHKLRYGAARRLHMEEFWALKDISFTLNQGDVMGIVGRNGAGKSTLLKILSRITSPTTGRATIHGRVGSLLEVGTGFHDELSGRENVFLSGTILGMTRKEVRRKYDEIVDFSGVSKFIDTPVKRYSSGMRVRLGFAVAAFFEPEILIVDEVLAVGDVEFQRRCLGKMNSVAESGRTVVFVSHNMFAMQQLTNRCLFLDQGKLVEEGPTEHVIERYLHMYAADAEGRITREMHKKADGVYVNSIRFFDQEGRETPSPQNFSPIVLSTTFTLEKQLPDLIFTIGVDTLDGKALTRFTTPPGYFGKGPFQPGQYKANVEFALPLHMGSYTTYVRIDESQRIAMCVAELAGAVSFDLLESRELGFDVARKPYQVSLLQVPMKWDACQYVPA